MMRQMTAVLLLTLGTMAADAPKLPKLSDTDKLELRDAQVEFLTAQQKLQASQEWINYQQASQKWVTAITTAYSHAGVKRDDYDLSDKLEFVKKAQPEPKK